MSRARSDSGYAAVQMALAAIVFLAFAGLVITAGRLNVAYSRVEAAARTSARTITLSRDPHAAVAEARQEAAEIVAAGSSMCRNWWFNAEITDESVTVTVHCDVLVEQTFFEVLPPFPVDWEATEVIDQYRSES